MMGAMVHRWVRTSALVMTASIVLACGGSVSATPAVLGPWQPQPFAVLDDTLARAAEAACRDRTPQAAGLAVVLHDQRGDGLDTVLFAGPGGEATCQVAGASDGSITWRTSSANSDMPRAAPDPLSLAIDGMGSSSGSDLETISDITGRTGAGVVAVRILLTDGNEVTATTSSGRFYAWWPGEAAAASLAADDATGRMVATITP
jgi:hypothetical protein